MRISSLLTTVAGATSASAAVMQIAAAAAPWKWTVTGWSAGCARECHYGKAPAAFDSPVFLTYSFV